MPVNLVHLINESTSLIDLEERLKEEGHSFTSYKDYLKFLDREWRRENSDNLRRFEVKPSIDDHLPTLTVELDGTSYFIHGISHGLIGFIEFLAAPGCFPSWKMRDYINEMAKSFHEPSRGVDYFYEQGLREVFGFLESNELKDHENTKTPPEFGIKKIFLMSALMPIHWIATTMEIVASFALITYAKRRFRPSDYELGSFYLAYKSMKDERYLRVLEEYHNATCIPQPIGLEREYVLKDGSTRGSLFDDSGLASIPERSLWTSRELPSRAKRDNLREVHYFCGSFHASQIEFFLRNPHYNFNHLDEHYFNRPK